MVSCFFLPLFLLSSLSSFSSVLPVCLCWDTSWFFPIPEYVCNVIHTFCILLKITTTTKIPLWFTSEAWVIIDFNIEAKSMWTFNANSHNLAIPWSQKYRQTWWLTSLTGTQVSSLCVCSQGSTWELEDGELNEYRVSSRGNWRRLCLKRKSRKKKNFC